MLAGIYSYGGKYTRKKYCNLFIGAYHQLFFLNNEIFGTGNYLIYWGGDTGGIDSLSVISCVITTVSVQRPVVLDVTQCILVEIYHPSFSYHDVRSGRFLHLNVWKGFSSFLQTLCKFLPNFITQKMKYLKKWGTV